MKKMKSLLLVLGMIIIAGSNMRAEKKILKNELPKTEKEFLENGNDRMIDLDDGNEVQPQDGEGQPKFLIKRIVLKRPKDGIKPLVSEKKLNGIVKEYENRELGISDLKQLVKRLNSEYASKGFITTRVYLEPDQNIQEGTVRLVALEGKLEDVILDGDTPKDRRRAFFAFTNEKGKVLNISHIDNGIDNLNRVESNSSKINIVPGTKQGYSKIIVESEKKKPFRFIVNYEDTQKDKEKYRISMEYDNLFGINDSISASYRGDMGKLAKKKGHKDEYAESYSFGYSFPFKSWSFSLSHDRSKDNSLFLGTTGNFNLKTKSRETGINATKLLYRDSGMKLNLSMGLNIKSERTYLAETRLETQDRNITAATVGINGMFKPFTGIATYSLSYSKGIKGFRAKEDNPYNAGTFLTQPVEESDNRYQFNKVNLNLSYYKPFYFNNQGITLRTVFNGQYSKDSLFSSEKFSIGGFDTVKGFPSSVSGDKGYSTKLELSYILPSDDSRIGQFLYKVRPYIEVDLGKVRNSYNSYGDSKGQIVTLSSYSAGIRYYGEIVTLDFGVAKTDKGRSLLKADPHRGFVSVTASF